MNTQHLTRVLGNIGCLINANWTGWNGDVNIIIIW